MLLACLFILPSMILFSYELLLKDYIPCINFQQIKTLYTFNLIPIDISFETLFNIPDSINTCFWRPLTWFLNYNVSLLKLQETLPLSALFTLLSTIWIMFSLTFYYLSSYRRFIWHWMRAYSPKAIYQLYKVFN